MEKYAELIKKAVEAKKFAYVPYSKFRVGSAVMTDNGKIYTGCNIENASYGATNCAERTAIFKAVSEGEVNIRAIAITSDQEDFISPCGICRQVIKEFGEEIDVILINKCGHTKTSSIKELLPQSFSKVNLKGTHE